jgi:hypothetical protein
MSGCSLDHKIPFLLSYVRYLKPIKLQTPLLSYAAYNITVDNINQSCVCLSWWLKFDNFQSANMLLVCMQKHLFINHKTN